MSQFIICDASPLILLAKINQLDLIHKVLEGETLVLQCIVDEVCSDSAGEVERIRRFCCKTPGAESANLIYI